METILNCILGKKRPSKDVPLGVAVNPAPIFSNVFPSTNVSLVIETLIKWICSVVLQLNAR